MPKESSGLQVSARQHIRNCTNVMNGYVAFTGGAIALIGVVSLVQTLGKNPDEPVWLRSPYQLARELEIKLA